LAEQIEARANEALDVAKKAAADSVNENAAIAALRVELENKRWLLSKLAPKRFGDKVQQEITGAGGTPLLPPENDRTKLALALLNIIRGDDDSGRFSKPLPIPEPPLQLIEREPVVPMSPHDFVRRIVAAECSKKPNGHKRRTHID
jgi:hypothetical protein